MDLTPRFAEAMQYAYTIHHDQYRKGSGIPYLAHLMSVSALVLEFGGSEDEAIAGLLHDAAEDRGGEERLHDIKQHFGDKVAQIVRECSDVVLAAGEKKPEWKERKRKYIDHIKEKSASARLVSAADKLHNARAILLDYREIGDELWSRFIAGKKEEIMWYYRSLVIAFREFGDSPLLDELDRVVRILEMKTGLRQCECL